LYPGSKTSVVSAMIIIMNMCTGFRVSNKFTDELFCFLSSDLLPTSNKLPNTHYKVHRNIWQLGLNYNNVHACPNNCVLYEDEYEALESCLKCNSVQWMDGTNSIPSKVIRNLPLIPLLKWMWRSSEIVCMLTGHTKHISNDGIMCSLVNSPMWKHIDNNIAFGNFGSEVRNLQLGLALDGVDHSSLTIRIG